VIENQRRVAPGTNATAGVVLSAKVCA